jgi:long-chain fatty acid transport protein
MIGAMAAASAAALDAQGFGLNEIGTCAVSRGFAATSAPCADGSAVFWNPAALTQLEGFTGSLGVARIGINAEFTADTTGRVFEGAEVVEYPPHAFVAYRLSPRWAVGAGLYVPYGLTSEWGADFPGRFIARRASLQTFYVQPSVAFELVPGWSVGGGPVFGRSSVELVQAVDLAGQTIAPGITFGLLGIPPGTEFARGSLEGSATAFGFNAGVQGRVGESVLLGVRYLSALDFEYDDATADFRQVETGLTVPADLPVPGGPTIPAGSPVDALLVGQFVPGGALSAQNVRTTITHPWQLQGGATFAVSPSTRVSLEAAVIGWSSFDELPVNFSNPATPDMTLIEDYETSWTLRLGAEHLFANGWTGRAGFAYSPTPAPDETVTPLLPEQDRLNYGVGLGVPVGGRWSVDLSYLRVQGEGRRGRIVERESRGETAAELNNGFYRLNANVLSIGVRFGSRAVIR